MNHNLPVRFDEAVGGLATGWACHNGRLVDVEEGTNCAAEKLFITVTTELMGEIAGFIAEG